MKIEKVKSEHSEQVQFVARVRAFYPKLVIFAVPNGGNREVREAVRLKAEGVLAGVPDLFIAYAAKGYNGMFIEMKKIDGTVSPHQKQMMERLRDFGYYCVVAFGADQAWDFFEDYIKD